MVRLLPQGEASSALFLREEERKRKHPKSADRSSRPKTQKEGDDLALFQVPGREASKGGEGDRAASTLRREEGTEVPGGAAKGGERSRARVPSRTEGRILPCSLRQLKPLWGFNPTPFQRRAAREALDENIIVHQKTGKGKTAIAALLFSERHAAGNGQRLMLFAVPTTALVNQQAMALARLCPWAKVSVVSGKRSLQRNMEAGSILVATAGRFKEELQKVPEAADRIETLVLDECQEATGNSPMTSMLKDAFTEDQLASVRTLGLTGSFGFRTSEVALLKKKGELEGMLNARFLVASDDSDGDDHQEERVSYERSLGQEEVLLGELLVGEEKREELLTLFSELGSAAVERELELEDGSLEGDHGLSRSSRKFEALMQRLDELTSRKTIVFCQRRVVAEQLTRQLRLLGKRTACLTGATSSERKEEALSEFKGWQTGGILVSTAACEVGLDVGDCDSVICYDKLSTTKSYIQSRGRARKKPSLLLLFEDDPKTLKEEERRMNRTARLPQAETSVEKGVEGVHPFVTEEGKRLSVFSYKTFLEGYWSRGARVATLKASGEGEDSLLLIQDGVTLRITREDVANWWGPHRFSDAVNEDRVANWPKDRREREKLRYVAALIAYAREEGGDLTPSQALEFLRGARDERRKRKKLVERKKIAEELLELLREGWGEESPQRKGLLPEVGKKIPLQAGCQLAQS